MALLDGSRLNTLQVKSDDVFDEWVSKLRHHRMYRQNEIAMFPRDVSHFFPGPTVTDSAPGVFEAISSRKVMIMSLGTERPILGVSLWVEQGKWGWYLISLLTSESDPGCN